MFDLTQLHEGNAMEHTDQEAIGMEYAGMYVVYRYWMNAGTQYPVIDAGGTSKGFFDTLKKAHHVIDTINRVGFYR
jgi:hypothetical protein